MASFQDLEFDWSMLCQECTDCWTAADLQLAAELGKTLLERNKELETSLKQHQNIIEDQTQEIEYLTKQTLALREVNDSRLRIYEQLEVSIHDLERTNHSLKIENSAEKKQIKNLCANIGTLEGKCDELQSTVDDLKNQLETYKRKCQQQETICFTSTPAKLNTESSNDKKVERDNKLSVKNKCNISTISEEKKVEIVDNEHLNLLTAQIHELTLERTKDQKRICELEEQLSALVQENQTLENQLVSITTKEEEMKSITEEFSSLDEVRQGLICSRCLQNVDDKMRDDLSILDPEEEDDDSMMDALVGETRYHSSVSLNIQQETNIPPGNVPNQSHNLYRDLVEKYEALVAVNRNHKSGNCMSLQEELQMSGDFNSLHMKDTDEESGHGDMFDNKNIKNSKDRKAFSQTPTDFSEAETSSSGFADETSNKATQTDGRPGSFLCTIADGEDCKFSIYDDASPIDSRFRNRPEYRELFKEIFTVLKKAAENKEEGEELPLLDDCTPISVAPKVPPVTPSAEDLPSDFTDDNQSVISSSAMSECSESLIEPKTVIENITKDKKLNNLEENKKVVTEKENKGPVLTPYKREPLEYISVSVNVRKKSSNKKHSKKQFADRSDSPILPLSPRINYVSNTPGQRKRRENRTNPIVDNNQIWNGATLQFWSSNRNNAASPTPSQSSNRSGKYEKTNVEFKPSSASHDLHKLKKLDMSYAEVLRNAGKKKREMASKSYQRK